MSNILEEEDDEEEEDNILNFKTPSNKGSMVGVHVQSVALLD